MREKIIPFLKTLQYRITERLSQSKSPSLLLQNHLVSVGLICGVIFLTALGVRLFHWQDTSLEIFASDTLVNNLGVLYFDEAQRILHEGGILFPNGKVELDDARAIIHPT